MARILRIRADFSFVAERSQVRGFGRIGADLRGVFLVAQWRKPWVCPVRHGLPAAHTPRHNSLNRGGRGFGGFARIFPRSPVAKALGLRRENLRSSAPIRPNPRTGGSCGAETRPTRPCPRQRDIRVHPPKSAPIRVPETPPATREKSARIRQIRGLRGAGRSRFTTHDLRRKTPLAVSYGSLCTDH